MANATCAAIYLRVSLDLTGEGLAVERQREDCERLVQGRGWSLVETYVDNSISATDKAKARPAYDQMVADYNAGKFDALVCWDLDRLTRQPRQLEDWIDAAEERGLLLVTANGEADLSTDGGRMYARIKAAVARAEVERKGARQSRAQRQRAGQGRPPRGVRATGYTLNGDVIPAEAKAVRAVFEAFATGASLKAIAAALSGAERVTRDVGDGNHIQVLPANVPALPTRNGKPWNPSSVTGILRNPRYAGWSVLAGEIVRDESGRPVRGQWEPIVPDSLWLDVQRRLDDPERRSNRAGTERKHLGSGLYLCGICGEPVKAHGGRYRCAGHVLRARTGVDTFVLEVVKARLARPDLANLLPTVDESRIEQLTEQVERERGRIKRARSDYREELIDGLLYREIKAEAEAEIQRLETERVSLSASPTTAAVLTADDPAEAFEHADLATRRAVIDTLAAVRLFPAQRGSKTFNPETVKVDPKTRDRPA